MGSSCMPGLGPDLNVPQHPARYTLCQAHKEGSEKDPWADRALWCQNQEWTKCTKALGVH